MTDTKLIAREPTEKMIAAGVANMGMMLKNDGARVACIFMTMFDAAPGYCYRSPTEPAPSPSEPTLRQRYAMAALIGTLAGRDMWPPSYAVLADQCGEIADAMIAAEVER